MKEDKQAIGWTVPIAAQAADTFRVFPVIGAFYVVTFAAVTLVFRLILLLKHLTRFRAADQDESLLRTAFICANIVGISILVMWVMLVLFARERLCLTTDGVTKRIGTLRAVIPYSAIREVRIEPSPRLTFMKCFAFLVMTNNGLAIWRRYTFGKSAPVDAIIGGLRERGIQIRADSADNIGGFMNE